MGYFTVIPLLAFPVAIYNIIAWADGTFRSTESVRERMNETFMSVRMASGGDWIMTYGHLMITFSLVMLFFELLKATGVGRAAVMNHAFSMVLFIICLIEFLMFKPFATSVFFLLMLMVLLDVMAGFMVTIASARRDFGVGDNFVD